MGRLVELQYLFSQLSVVGATDFSERVLVLNFVVNAISQNFSLLAHFGPDLLMERVTVYLV